MPRIYKSQFTNEELKVIKVVFGQIGGNPDNSYRRYIDSVWNKISDDLFKDEESWFMQCKLEMRGKDSAAFAKFNNGFFKED